MRPDLRSKGWLYLIILGIFATLISPWGGTTFFKGDPIRLGLDLKGGIELLLVPDYRVGANVLTKLSEDLGLKFRQAGIAAPQLEPLGVVDNNRYDGMRLLFASPVEAQRAVNIGAFSARYQLDFYGETKILNLQTQIKGRAVELKVLEDASNYPEDALQRSKAIIENRISQASASMAEADVRLDRKGRINVQLPGVQTLQEAKDLITVTGRLTFRINNRIMLDGTDLKEIGVRLDPNRGGYVIAFAFKGKGAQLLEQITTEYKGKQMGVYLDEKMLMDPTIQDALLSGEGIITFGRDTTKEEIDRYALLMKSGALPISLKVVQATQVAPTLGKEIVKQSLISGAIGIGLVALFMILFYSLPGLLANLALVVYGITVLGVMALFRGVLTLPGVAGIILSVGMAVDANIIIFERIKDELRNGKRVRPAINSGYERAWVTIVDSNVTTLIAAFVLLIFGSGAVQGFAVTLSIGVVVSMFTAIFLTRFLLEWRVDHDPDHYAKYFGVKEVMPQ